MTKESPMPKLTSENIRETLEQIHNAKPVDDSNPKIIGAGGYVDGEPGFDQALEAFRKEHMKPFDVSRVEAAFDREFNKEKR